MLERDDAYRFHEEELRGRDRQIEELRLQLAEMQAWAQELQASVRDLQQTRAWRLAVRLRSLRRGARRLVRLG
jgi:hypothetical protein